MLRVVVTGVSFYTWREPLCVQRLSLFVAGAESVVESFRGVMEC